MSQIPRGLRIKKFPTSELFDDHFKKKLTDTLNICSFKLMNILISSKKKVVEILQAEISSIQKDLTALQTHAGFINLDGRLNKKLDKMEKSVIDNKIGRMTWDRIDCDYDYVWRKPQSFSGRSRRNRGKQVSFSDQESEQADDTFANTALRFLA